MWDSPEIYFISILSSVANIVKLDEDRPLLRRISTQALVSGQEGRDKNRWDLVISLSDLAWRLLWSTLIVNLTKFGIN